MRSKLLCGVSALMLFAPTSAWGAVTEQAGPGSQTKLASPGVGDAASPQTQADSAQQSEIDAGQLKDIVVTAERRTENLQKVPIAATSMSSDASRSRANGVVVPARPNGLPLTRAATCGTTLTVVW